MKDLIAHKDKETSARQERMDSLALVSLSFCAIRSFSL